jgi:O-acetylserine/cysteine efflux transporter
VVLGIVVLREHPRPAQVAGVGLGVVGLAVIAVGRGGAVPGLALVLCVAAALSWACGNIASRRCRGDSGLSLAVWSGLVVPLPMFALSLLVNGPQEVGHALTHLTAVNWLSTAYTAGLASLFGYGVWNGLLGRHRVAEVAPFTLLVPVVGMATAFVVQGERPTLFAVLGGGLLVAGVALSLGGFPRRRSKTQVMTAS